VAASDVKTKPPTVTLALYVLVSNSFAVKAVAWTNSAGGSTLEEEELLELVEEELVEEAEEPSDEGFEETEEEEASGLEEAAISVEEV